MLPFHLICFPISPSILFFSDVLSQAFMKHRRKAFVCININNIYSTYFRKLMNFCLTKNL